MFYTYIIFSHKLNKYYIGSTENIQTRIQNHNIGLSNFTAKGIPWELKYFELFETRTLAIKREFEIKKKKSRKYIEFLIHNFKPDS